MARGINKVIIVGNCGQDPETRYLPSGGAVTNMSLATSEALHSKSDIAAELAWRDREIDRLKAELEESTG